MISIHNQALPMHLACMFELKHLHSKLFLLAHEMVDREPDNALSWYAVGMWYLSKGSWGQARQFFAYVYSFGVFSMFCALTIYIASLRSWTRASRRRGYRSRTPSRSRESMTMRLRRTRRVRGCLMGSSPFPS